MLRRANWKRQEVTVASVATQSTEFIRGWSR